MPMLSGHLLSGLRIVGRASIVVAFFGSFGASARHEVVGGSRAELTTHSLGMVGHKAAETEIRRTGDKNTNGWHWVSSSSNRDAVIVDKEKGRTVGALWAWHGSTPPILAQSLEDAARRAPTLDVETLRVEVLKKSTDNTNGRADDPEPAQPPDDQPSLWVLAGPVALWESVPEGLLPRYEIIQGRVNIPRIAGQAWRLRLIGESLGSTWTDVPVAMGKVALVPQPAASRTTEFLLATAAEDNRKGDRSGPSPARTFLVLDEARDGTGPTIVAQVRAVGDLLEILSLPHLARISGSFESPGFVPQPFEGKAREWPNRVVLEPGTEISGRIAGVEGKPVPNASIKLQTWRGTQLLERRVSSDQEGGWRFEGIPVGDVALRFEAEGKVPRVEHLRVDSTGLRDLEVVLPAARSLEVVAVDTGHRVVPSATFEFRGKQWETNHLGVAVLKGVPTNTALLIEADAPGFLSRKIRLVPPFDPPVQVPLAAAFEVVGTLVSDSGRPLGKARVEWLAGKRSDRIDLESDFRFELEPDVSYRLRFTTDSTLPYELELEPHAAGEVLDLGLIELEGGIALVGRVVSAESGDGLVAAEVRALRPGRRHSMDSWFFNDWLVTSSTEGGHFELEGLADRGEIELRVEATDHARRDLRISLTQNDRTELDLGEIELERAAIVVVHVAEDDFNGDAIARLDLSGRWLEKDMLSAPVSGGQATLHGVPHGRMLMTVVELPQRLVCEEWLEIPPGDREVEVRCEPDEHRVHGTVSSGEAPLGPGTLLWWSSTSDSPHFIRRTSTSMGLSKTEVFGAGRPQVSVPVDVTGYYETANLTPGRWSVTWWPDGGTGGEPQDVALQDLPVQELNLDFPSFQVSGSVVDGEGLPVRGARVRETSQGIFTFTDEDGRFELALGPGEQSVTAEFDELRSEPAIVSLSPEAPHLAVELVLADQDRQVLRGIVSDLHGAPVPGAFLFVRTDSGVQRTLTADSEGRFRLRLQGRAPAFFQIAAHGARAWMFGPQRPWEEALQQDIEVRLPPTGGFIAPVANPIRILTGEGWDLLDLRRRLGLGPSDGDTSDRSPGKVLLLGLPEGTYSVESQASVLRVRVEEGRLLEYPQ